MFVVADTSPINYLVLIDEVDILARLYTQVAIPPAVLAELEHPIAPKAVRDWASDRPSWLKLVRPKYSVVASHLDLGEREAIALAAELNADVLLIDDHAGRQEARRRGLKIAGTLSVLDEADRAGLLNFEHAIAELRKTSFRVAQSVLAEILKKRLR